MNFSKEQLTRHAENIAKKKERIETLEALLATHEAMGAEPDSAYVTELKQRIRAGRVQLMSTR
jgi:TRAP-type C4-dicarboxylate transport system substrate-binding protein